MAGTIQQIADLAGVSRGTVDRALNNRGRIKPEVAAKIKEIADELGYQSNRGFRNPDKGQLKLKIGIVTHLSKSSFMIQVNKGISQAAEELLERGVEILLRDSVIIDEKAQLQAIEELEALGIDGLAIMPVECDLIRTKINQLTEEKHIPVITFNSDIVGTKRCCFVGLDNRRSGYTAAGLMGMLTGKKGKILIITGYFTNSVNSLRVEGFIEETKRSFPDMELLGVQSSFDEAQEVERIIENTLSMVPDLAGIFVASGGQAGVRQAFEKLNSKRRPYVIIYDLTPRNEKALLEDDVDFLIDQEGYEQGYRPPFLLYDMIVKGGSADREFVYTDINIKTKYNL